MCKMKSKTIFPLKLSIIGTILAFSSYSYSQSSEGLKEKYDKRKFIYR